MGSYTDFSQLKKFRPAGAPAPEPVRPIAPEDRALREAGNSADYFSSLLGGDGEEAKPKRAPAPVPPRRTTVVTPATVARVKEEQAEAARAAERAAFQAREDALKEEVELQKAACASIAADLAAARQELENAKQELADAEEETEALNARRLQLEEENRRLTDELAAARALPPRDDAQLAAKDAEIARLQAQLAEAQKTSLSSSVLLEKPAGLSEKFAGELREHLAETIADAVGAAEAAGRDRRARILEAVLVANPPSGDLDRRREAVRQIVKEAGARLDNAAIAELEKLGFRYVSGNKHHKLEWAGIRFPLAKTPSDYRACLNSASEICNRVF